MLRVALLCAAVLPASLGAQVARPLTPEEAVRLGLEHNARVRGADARADAARASERQVRASRLPAIRGEGSYARLSGNIPGVEFTFPGSDSTITFQGVQLDRMHTELNLEQPIFTGFRLQNQVRAASREAEAAALDATQARADVALEIRRSYWELYRAVAVRAAVDAAVAHVDGLLADVRRRLAEGAALTRDLLSAETRRAEIQVERVAADNAVRVGQLELNRLMGLPLDTRVEPAAAAEVSTPVVTLEALMAEALERRAELGALRERVRAREALVAVERGSHFPELRFIGRYVYARPNPYFFAEQDRFHNTWELGLSARWNIWEGGGAGARVAEARAGLELAQAQLAEAREQIAVDAARQLLEVQRTADAVAAAAQNVAAAEEAFRVARQQYDEGVALSSDVLDAEQALWRARARRAESLADHAIAHAALQHARGRIE